jgi:DNA-binding response OmpR family regulator
MITQTQLKILAFGSPVMIDRITDMVNQEEVRITGYSEGSTGIALLEKEPFDMVIVDNLSEDADSICQNAICLAAAPVALFVRESGTDWRRLREVEVDGYLPDGTGKAEFMARLKTFFRRKPAARKV